jgi:predicted RNA-binding Zn ribbon-like protein
VQFDHHNMTGVRLAAALVNLAEPWDAVVLDGLLQEHWISRVDLSAPVCEGLRQLAGRLRLVFEESTPQTRCEAINALLAGRASPFLTMHDGLPPHLHFASTEDELVHRVTAFTAGSLAMFTVEAAGRRLGTCARQGCRTVYVDTSLNGRRTYCSSRCANSDAVGRHRQRKRADASA